MLKPRPSLSIGGGRALVQLASREYVCVDLRSLDSLAYLLGWDLECDVVRVFRMFLTPRSVVLDIGASFGLYTALAASIVATQGRLFAFEGNPEVFPSLQRTLIANGLYGNPNVLAANLLVSDSCGYGTLHYAEHAFGGGTMLDTPLPGGKRQSVNIEMTTIDAFLPPNTAVDLVKIDVEGHEPLVVRGMEETIARSPNLRLIIEFSDSMLAQIMPAAGFVDYPCPRFSYLPDIAGFSDQAGAVGGGNCRLQQSPLDPHAGAGCRDGRMPSPFAGSAPEALAGSAQRETRTLPPPVHRL